MIIANMGDSYARVKQAENAEITMERAKLIITTELLYPRAHSYATYMHLLMPSRLRENAQHWQGIGGALKQMNEDLQLRISRVEEKLDARLGEITQKLSDIRNRG